MTCWKTFVILQAPEICGKAILMFGLKFNLETFVASQFAHAQKLSRKKQCQYDYGMLWEIWKVCIKKSKQSRKAKNILGCDAILVQVSETALSLSFSGKMRIEWSDMTHSCWDVHEENFIIQGMNLKCTKSKGEKKFILNTWIMFGFDKYQPFLTWNVRTPLLGNLQVFM